eukprot:CAMPEP_0176312568 /NCGR_PEP_ID=MMETSP0121_2-20121125/66732_1 /TAXON_ID=160619 /ORGANISM="Kryptoperidinium foliaceum, Strain CCMP 1326" /LENGTH=48 /DNA_ID= /DNA_START= /DNA_END= /DNA_ORIENTATION=
MERKLAIDEMRRSLAVKMVVEQPASPSWWEGLGAGGGAVFGAAPRFGR